VQPEESPPVQITIETERTLARLACESDAAAILEYYTTNREHLKAWDPERPGYFYDQRFWKLQIRQNIDDFLADRALRLFLSPRNEPRLVIGNIAFSNFVRGVGQSCTLGYSIDAGHQGRGLMGEALAASIHYVFQNLHFRRIEANYMPKNLRSGKLLRRQGFVVEGYSRDYLRIDGEWQDHIRTALVNPRWIDSIH